MKYITLIFVTFILLLSCNKREYLPFSARYSNVNYITDSSAVFDHNMYNDAFFQNDPFDIQDVDRFNDAISVLVSYGGGCKEHDFNIICDSTLLHAENPVVNFIIFHNNNMDNCEALVLENIIIDLNRIFINIPDINIPFKIINGSNDYNNIVVK